RQDQVGIERELAGIDQRRERGTAAVAAVASAVDRRARGRLEPATRCEFADHEAEHHDARTHARSIADPVSAGGHRRGHRALDHIDEDHFLHSPGCAWPTSPHPARADLAGSGTAARYGTSTSLPL